MSIQYLICDMSGDGSPNHTRDVARWHAPRWDVLCRVVRGNLACILADGTPNPSLELANIQFKVYADCSPAFGVAVANFPDDWTAALEAHTFHPNEPRPGIMYQMQEADPGVLKEGCITGSQQGIAMVNAANLGFTIGTVDPVGDIMRAMEAMTFTVAPTMNAGFRDHYVARLQGAALDQEPAVALAPNGLWDTTVMVDYANTVDVAPPTDPANAIHILYELAGALALANSTEF